MEVTARPRLHPLLTAAAISVTVFSAVGVGALTGFLPTSHSTSPESVPVSAAPAPQAAPQAVLPEITPAMPAAPASSPAPKPVKKHVARVPAPKPAEPVAPVQEVPQIAQANIPPPPPAPIEAPRPVVPAGIFGVVQSVREVSTPAKSNGVGPIAGGIAGAVLGNQVGHGTGRTIATVLGAAGGAFAGKEIEQQARATKSWEITVRLDDGSYRTVSTDAAPIWHGGERVRLVDGRLQPA